MRSKIKVNDAALKKLVASKLKDADRKIRQKHAGKPARDITAAVKKELEGAGVRLPGKDLENYVASVSERRDFRFNVKM